MKPAIQHFESAESVRSRVFGALRDGLQRSEASIQEILSLVHLNEPAVLTSLETGTSIKADLSDVLSLMAVFEVPIDATLSFWPPLTAETKKAWLSKMQITDGGAAGTVAACEHDSCMTEDAGVELFIRLEALKEVFTQ